MKKIIKQISCLSLVMIITCVANAQGDGPRAWWPAPNNINVISPLYLNINNSNQVINNNIFFRDADLSTNIYGLTYTRAFDLKGHPLGLMGAITGGTIVGGIDGEGANDQITANVDVSGLSDFQIFAVYGITGSPTVRTFEEMMTPDKYNFILEVLFGVKVPIGSYDNEQQINFGANRWEFRVGFPMIKYLNWGKPNVTSFEVTPNIYMYTANNDPAGADKLEQKSVFAIEGHITQGINQMLWVSIDTYFKTGGETTIDGLGSDNVMNGTALGGTLGAYFSKNVNIKASYGAQINTDDNLTGTMFRVFLTYMF